SFCLFAFRSSYNVFAHGRYDGSPGSFVVVGTQTPSKLTLPSCMRGVGPDGGAGALRGAGGGTPPDCARVFLAAEGESFSSASRCAGSWLFSLQTYSVISNAGSSAMFFFCVHAFGKTPGSSIV